jgi:putative transposase
LAGQFPPRHPAGQGAAARAPSASGLASHERARATRARSLWEARTTRAGRRTCRRPTCSALRNHALAKSISAAGWAAFLSIRTDKAACAGRSVVAAPPAFTSQRCSGCGALVQKGLSVRWHSCPEGGASLPRDHNAARYRERLGQSLRGGAGVPASENRASMRL